MSIVKTADFDNKTVPIRYDMFDIKKGSITLLEFIKFDKTIELDKDLFRYQSLGKE